MSDLKPVYLIAGSDRPKVQRAVERLKGHFDPAGIEHLSAETASGDEAVAACNSLGLFATGGRLVLVTDVDGHRNKEGRLAGGWKAADIAGRYGLREGARAGDRARARRRGGEEGLAACEGRRAAPLRGEELGARPLGDQAVRRARREGAAGCVQAARRARRRELGRAEARGREARRSGRRARRSPRSTSRRWCCRAGP